MKPKKPDGNGDVPQHVLNKELTRARTDETRARERANITREKKMRLQLAQARGDVVEKDLVTKQAAFLFVAMRQKMLAVPLAWHRKLLNISNPRRMIELLTEMQHELLRELADMPKRVTDPNWLEALSDEEDV
jgi:phage terminase Nu1 subunit (DNA packaging protein)